MIYLSYGLTKDCTLKVFIRMCCVLFYTFGPAVRIKDTIVADCIGLVGKTYLMQIDLIFSLRSFLIHAIMNSHSLSAQMYAFPAPGPLLGPKYKKELGILSTQIPR